MPYTRHTTIRYAGNSRVSSRSRQLVVLLAVIVIGMIISAAVNAIPDQKGRPVANQAGNEMLTSMRP